MIYREAAISDISQLQEVRQSVRENVLSNPALVTYEDYVDYLSIQGKGWVCETEGNVAGFAIVDLAGPSIWALFVRPEHEGKGIGRKLHDLLLDWYFSHSAHPIWLGTDPHTRAESFYLKAGWQAIGIHGNGEVKFEMTRERWLARPRPQTNLSYSGWPF